MGLLVNVVCLVLLANVACADSLQSLEAEVDDIEGVMRFQSSSDLEQGWQAFKDEFGKTYDGADEEETRKQIFAENLKEIEMHNYLYSKGLKTFTMGVNQFSDLKFSEFLELMTGNLYDNIKTDEVDEADDDAVDDDDDETSEDSRIPRLSVDWRKKGYVTRVKKQGHCGSCWAFSATGALEGQNRRKTGKLVELSEQNLVDCSDRVGNHGCKGGLAAMAFTYITLNDGIDTEKSYPYETKNGTCRFKRANVGASCSGFWRIRGGEKKLRTAVAKYGPVSVSINVQKSFHQYKSGFYYEPSCSSTKLGHAVLAVGYGTSKAGQYWIVKNSWGTGWGENGYILMARNKKNNCGIATRPVLPLV